MGRGIEVSRVPPGAPHAMTPLPTHEAGRAERGAELARLERRANRIATVRLVLAGACLFFLVAGAWGRSAPWPWEGLGLAILGFIVFVIVHARVHDDMARASAALRFHTRALARLALAWDELPLCGERYRTPGHPFALDLDVFGRASLMQLLDVTETRFGEEHLARLLSGTELPGWPEDVLARQEAARDMAARVGFREALSTAGGLLADEKPDPAPLLAWAEGRSQAGVPSAAARALAWGLPIAGVAAVTGASAVGAGGGLLVAIVVTQLAVGLAAAARLAPSLEQLSSRQSAVTRWRSMLALVERQSFTAPRLLGLQERLGGGASSSEGLRALERIVGFVDARRNEVFRFFIGPLLMWDVHCLAALERWRRRHGERVRSWLETLGEVEALAGLAAFAFEHPDFCWPVPAPEASFDAASLGHPMIPADRRVGNDVRLPGPGHAIVVTGSNMSGKSTLLRTIGVNAVLAFAGAPACARSLTMGPSRLATSMRVEDSLEQGVSHFYAELRRLKGVLDLARGRERPAVLFLLDEILHGTNSRERILGAGAVVQELLARGALGAISTHDLGITALEREAAGRVENLHFEEQVSGETMTFDYRLRPGIVQSSNALRLMRAIGILTGAPEP
ncbi:MAG: DNA mismatch repair protein MutS [Myxococcales bacterium]|nr:DNA mismatch repair protein MutS [Myxococcales bacterium]